MPNSTIATNLSALPFEYITVRTRNRLIASLDHVHNAQGCSGTYLNCDVDETKRRGGSDPGIRAHSIKWTR